VTTSEDLKSCDSEEAEVYRVPKTPVSVRVLLEGGSNLEGALHLTDGSPEHGGRERVVDLLERERRFVPLTLEKETRLLNTDRIAVVTVTHPTDAGLEGAALEVPIPEVPVTIEMAPNLGHPTTILGRMRLDLPLQRGRILDLLNGERKFVTVIGDREILLISKHYVSAIVQMNDAS